MKFVCDNCKAKYQIGDDKVAGKTVRMKCRKCGYNIKVSPDGTALSADAPSHELDAPLSVSPASLLPVSAAAPRPPVSMGPQAAPRAPVPAPRASHTGPTSAAAEPGWSEGDDESTAIMNAPVRDAVAAVMASSKPAGAIPIRPAPAPPPPRPVTTAPHAPRPLTPRPTPAAPPRSVTATMVGIARPVTMGGPESPPKPPEIRAGRLIARPAGAAAAAVQHEHTPPPHAAPPHAAAQSAPEQGWFVGVAGSPIGPIGVSVIRERAAANEVDGDSLVWREGMGEWRPLRTFPELLEALVPAPAPRAVTPTPLAAVVAPRAPVSMGPQAAPNPGPASRAPAPVAAAPRPAPAPTPAQVAAAPAAPAPVPVAAAPRPAPVPTPAPVAAPAASAPGPIAAAPTPAPAPVATTPAPIAAAPASLQGLSDPFVAPAPATHGTNGKANGLHPGSADPFGGAAPPAQIPADAPVKPAAKVVDIDPAVEAALIPRRRGSLHPMAYAFIASATVFSGVAAYVVFLKPPPPPQIVVVQAPAAPGVAATPKSGDDKGQPQVEVGDLSTAPVGSAGRPLLGKAWPKSTASATASTSAPLDTSGFINNVPGPQATAPSGPPAGGQLSQGEMNGVVASNQPRVRRKCWQPALDGQSANGPKSARVSVSITIGASGNVESASASGAERDFPGLASCIAGQVQTWKFPPSGGSTPVNVPFFFAGQ
jgi:predicted Zn finger-like uncharacterized protein